MHTHIYIYIYIYIHTGPKKYDGYNQPCSNRDTDAEQDFKVKDLTQQQAKYKR